MVELKILYYKDFPGVWSIVGINIFNFGALGLLPEINVQKVYLKRKLYYYNIIYQNPLNIAHFFKILAHCKALPEN